MGVGSSGAVVSCLGGDVGRTPPKSHGVYFYVGNVAKSKALDHDRSAMIECTRGLSHPDHARGYLRGL